MLPSDECKFVHRTVGCKNTFHMVASVGSDVACAVDIGLYKHRMSNERFPFSYLPQFWGDGVFACMSAVRQRGCSPQWSIRAFAVQSSVSGTVRELFRILKAVRTKVVSRVMRESHSCDRFRASSLQHRVAAFRLSTVLALRVCNCAPQQYTASLRYPASFRL